MRLTKTELTATLAQIERLRAELDEQRAIVNAHYTTVAQERRAKRKPPQPAKSPISNHDVAIVRQYAREFMNNPQIFNSRRTNDRRVKMWVGLTPEQIKTHSRALLKLLPHARITLAQPPRMFTDSDKRCLCVVLPIQ